MYSNDRLFADHAELRAISAELRELCSHPEPAERDRICDVRWRMARCLLRNLPLKDRMVYSRLRSHPDPKIAAVAKRYSDETLLLYGQFEKHMENWPPQRVETEWPGYCVGAKQMTSLLEARLAREENELLPHLDGAPQIPPQRRDGDRNWAADGWRIRALLGIDPPSSASNAA
ncbi:hemerythrin domain-containing protein [Stakelama sp. CBK3Z-3]|uniref:Hemerythrin domain-containing protein n=1 Tax=Stakelama flava TaxID=2860338 RepID=A0ABS6XPP2_9SPHN|nr:hemerythrin domain-containing protein [Stakelama flava]MBW4332182.1 hemerythrin domain-containing protein [Stakelama flava]